MKKFVILYTVISMILLQSIGIYANEEAEYLTEAKTLQELGLFKGSNEGFELDRAPTRVESAVMLIRLIGKENEVLNNMYEHPFTDVPEWANQYIGYMYENALTKGIGDNLFGSNNLTDAKSYATFVLRSLGYDDSIGEFSWNTALDTLVEKGIVSNEENSQLKSRDFLRGEMINLSYNALEVKMNGVEETLIEYLINKAAVDKNIAEKHELIPETKLSIEEALKKYIGNVYKYEVPIKNKSEGYAQLDINVQEIVPEELFDYISGVNRTGYAGLIDEKADIDKYHNTFYSTDSLSASSFSKISESPYNIQLFWKEGKYGNEYTHEALLFKDDEGNNIGFAITDTSTVTETTVTFTFVPYKQELNKKNESKFNDSVEAIITELETTHYIGKNSKQVVREIYNDKGDFAYLFDLPIKLSNARAIPIQKNKLDDANAIITKYYADYIYQRGREIYTYQTFEFMEVENGYYLHENWVDSFGFIIIVDSKNKPIAYGFTK